MSERKGLIIVHTGNGKGKTTAALGMGMRAWGQGLKVLVIQFIKGNRIYGELKTIARLGPDFEIRQMGEGFIKGPNDDAVAEHRRAAEAALQAAGTEISSEKWDLVILDEINYAISYGLVPLDAVLGLLDQKPPSLHLVLTGRDASPEVIERADLVTEMREVKHPLKNGIKAQKGIEF
ncbi:cob(I)yrinic acid a,c-diamide adenosyltransferase CobO [Thermacetogenium phaeum DSM 12270]|uniref:Cob(I)yrinic acid a,c-diamide adenosyltransferase CobO n=1 Tax=Thermacetogenium phaeum (strain ATCC BAA-254 / DSM 26808 / PB) TaxID=1089553 RepID=K4LF28_THEPS|nr:cob(I)yrinic acid a,c-diamide adenosyltransferase [Thermacetogenium phaeum]AFV10595.1 cob(I)yrinic acid a,c-diamide adenosyltransferase CobO [Thermacetogenium phaeum DSM 12270]